MRHKFIRLAAALAGVGVGMPALAQSNPQHLVECPSRPYRWLEDCSNLATADLNGLNRLRYITAGDRQVWLTVGGEARIRMDLLHDIDFGINSQPGYVSTSGRLLLHGDLRAKAGPRVFVQLGIVEENGRKPGARVVDESQVDLTQGFVDVPIKLGAVGLLADYDLRAGFASAVDGDTLVLLGATRGELGASIYLREVQGREDGAPPPVDLELERVTGDFVRGLIEAGDLTCVHDLSDGGLIGAAADRQVDVAPYGVADVDVFGARAEPLGQPAHRDGGGFAHCAITSTGSPGGKGLSLTGSSASTRKTSLARAFSE